MIYCWFIVCWPNINLTLGQRLVFAVKLLFFLFQFGGPYPALASHLYLKDVWESVRAKIPTYTDPQLKQHILAQYTLISRAEKVNVDLTFVLLISWL